MSSYRNIVSDVVSADRLISTEPCLLHGAVILASALGGDATIYDGHDATTGKSVLPLKGAANISNPIMFPEPVFLARGLFVDVGSSITSVAIIWEPLGE